MEAGEVEAALGAGERPERPQRNNAGVIARRYSDSQFRPPKVVKPVPRESGAAP